MTNPIITSATKITLLVIVAILCLMALFACAVGVLRGTLDPKEIIGIFSSAVLLVLGFYFGKRESTAGPVIEPVPEKEIDTTDLNVVGRV
jgi:hypothetical protein